MEDSAPETIFTYEDLSEDHLAIARTARQFWTHEVEPNLDAIRHKEPGVLAGLLRKSAELGLTAISIPEEYGGLGLDLASSLVVEEVFARDLSYLVTHGGQTGIGALPIVYFGSDQQKRKYLPLLGSAERIAAYALTEPQSGSDALAVRTRADLSLDGTHYILSGQKMWITNAGIADLFIVFAKVSGEHFTAFLVERNWPGVSIGAEEKKMGLDGSSTTAVFFDNVAVPVENLLGETGRGHIIAFNILNLGRLKLGISATGSAKEALDLSLRYSQQRTAFGSPIATFGAIRHKLSEMAARIYAAESMAWRVAGLIDSASASDPQSKLKAAEEFAVECSIVKVYASEAMGFVADEAVQVHGGYGYHRDYAVERIYRDARIFRIFEGTNEINRQLILSMLLKRDARGRINLLSRAAGAGEALHESSRSPATQDSALRWMKQIFLAALHASHQKFGAALDQQQEVVMRLSDIATEIFALESALLRTRKVAAPRNSLARAMTSVLMLSSIDRVASAARVLFSHCSEDWSAAITLPPPGVGEIALRREIAATLLAAGRYRIAS